MSNQRYRAAVWKPSDGVPLRLTTVEDAHLSHAELMTKGASVMEAEPKFPEWWNHGDLVIVADWQD